MIAFTMTLALAPWFANPSIKRWMPTSTPYAAQEIAIVSSAPAGSGLPIGLMPGALPSDHASRHTLNTTAIRLPSGHTHFTRPAMRSVLVLASSYQVLVVGQAREPYAAPGVRGPAA